MTTAEKAFLFYFFFPEQRVHFSLTYLCILLSSLITTDEEYVAN